MTDKSKMHWPSTGDSTYRRWDLPAQSWSKAEYGEDTVRIFHDLETNEWRGDTEFNQNAHRDLEPTEVAQVREEFGLK